MYLLLLLMLKVDFLGDGKPGKREHLPLSCWTSGIVLQMRTLVQKRKGGFIHPLKNTYRVFCVSGIFSIEK